MTHGLHTLAALSLSVWLGLGASASGQHLDGPANAPVNRQTPPRWHLDLAASFGDIKVDLQPGRYPTFTGGARPQRSTWSQQVTVGVWRKQWKAEFEYGGLAAKSRQDGRETTGTRADVFDTATIATSSATTRVNLLHNYQVRRYALAGLRQFRSGARVRPYLGVAVGADRETHFDDRFDSIGAPLSDAERLAAIARGEALPVDPYPSTFARTTTTHVHVAAKAGIKLYFLFDRVFVQAEAIAGTRTGPVKLGIGLDLL